MSGDMSGDCTPLYPRPATLLRGQTQENFPRMLKGQVSHGDRNVLRSVIPPTMLHLIYHHSQSKGVSAKGVAVCLSLQGRFFNS